MRAFAWWSALALLPLALDASVASATEPPTRSVPAAECLRNPGFETGLSGWRPRRYGEDHGEVQIVVGVEILKDDRRRRCPWDGAAVPAYEATGGGHRRRRLRDCRFHVSRGATGQQDDSRPHQARYRRC